MGEAADAGWQLLQALRGDARTRQIPVIVLSAAPSRSQARADDLAELGVPVLAKPFDVDVLSRQIRGALAQAAERDRPSA